MYAKVSCLSFTCWNCLFHMFEWCFFFFLLARILDWKCSFSPFFGVKSFWEWPLVHILPKLGLSLVLPALPLLFWDYMGGTVIVVVVILGVARDFYWDRLRQNDSRPRTVNNLIVKFLWFVYDDQVDLNCLIWVPIPLFCNNYAKWIKLSFFYCPTFLLKAGIL